MQNFEINSKSYEGNFGNCFDNEEYYRNWIKIFFFILQDFRVIFLFEKKEEKKVEGRKISKERNFGNYFDNEEYYRIIIIIEYYYRIIIIEYYRIL